METDSIVGSLAAEYLRYKALAEAALAQLDDSDLCARGPNGGNSVAIICWHLSGNLRSRFTDFLTTDGEKPWRKREEEFQARTLTRTELLAKWNEGWDVLNSTLRTLHDEDLARTVSIRGQSFRVHEALHRSFAHVAYHVGQIVYIAKAMCGSRWTYLSIPPGESDAYNAHPTNERPAAHLRALSTQKTGR